MKRKTTIKIETIKPRNHLVALSHQRKAGSHQKPGKSLRLIDKLNLKKHLTIDIN